MGTADGGLNRTRFKATGGVSGAVSVRTAGGCAGSDPRASVFMDAESPAFAGAGVFSMTEGMGDAVGGSRACLFCGRNSEHQFRRVYVMFSKCQEACVQIIGNPSPVHLTL